MTFKIYLVLISAFDNSRKHFELLIGKETRWGGINSQLYNKKSGGNGITFSLLAAEIISDIIAGKKERGEYFFF